MVVAGLPATRVLFEHVGGRYVLCAEGLAGRVTARGEVVALAEAGGPVPLEEDARGKIELGDTALLFQFVVPPPVMPRPKLPVGTRGFAAGIDWVFTAIVVSSYMALFGFIVALESADWRVPPTIAEVPASGLRCFQTAKPRSAPRGGASADC